MKTSAIFESRYPRWVVAGIASAVLLYFVPLFHVVPLDASRTERAAAAFDPDETIEAFWRGPLREAAASAPDAAELLAAFRQDYAATAARYGHRLGLGNSSFYLVRGEGHIVAADEQSVGVSLDDGDTADIVIDIGPVFGNAIRDGSGLLDVSTFENAQDFNALSQEINRRVEERVLPRLIEGAAEGRVLRFAGATELPDAGRTPESLVIVPVSVEFP